MDNVAELGEVPGKRTGKIFIEKPSHIIFYKIDYGSLSLIGPASR
jgi:hypothetical protein